MKTALRFLFLILFLENFQLVAQTTIKLNEDSLKINNVVYLPAKINFHSGDSLLWANPNFNFSNWDLESIQILPKDSIKWNGIGWLRLKNNLCKWNFY